MDTLSDIASAGASTGESLGTTIAASAVKAAKSLTDLAPFSVSSVRPPVYRPPPQTMAGYAARARGRENTIARFLKRLGWVIAIAMGVGSVFAGVWSRIFLPLLYSSFSARKALTDQQSASLTRLITGLKLLRSQPLYGPPKSLSLTRVVSKPETVDITSDAGGERDMKSSLLIEDVSSEQGHDHPLPSLPSPPTISLLPSLSTLPESLKSLSTSLSATQTTRTSLLSSLSSYTSHLHTQNFMLARPGAGRGGMGVGMGSLGANLKSAGGGDGKVGGKEEGGLGGVEGWDEVRKEIRAIKGMLLSRRAFPGVGTRTQVGN